MFADQQIVQHHQLDEGVEYLAFKVGNSEYGVNIQQVQELRTYEPVTSLAASPDFMKGVVNLRGVIVPIVDLRIKLGYKNPVYDSFTVVVVLSIESKVFGLVVDGVSDVVRLKESQIDPARGISGSIKGEYLMGLGSIDDRMIILVDMFKFLSDGQSRLFDQPEKTTIH